jgi:hypothetical protein
VAEAAVDIRPRGKACTGAWPPISSERVPVSPGIVANSRYPIAGPAAASFSGSAPNMSDSTCPMKANHNWIRTPRSCEPTLIAVHVFHVKHKHPMPRRGANGPHSRGVND